MDVGWAGAMEGVRHVARGQLLDRQEESIALPHILSELAAGAPWVPDHLIRLAQLSVLYPRAAEGERVGVLC